MRALAASREKGHHDPVPGIYARDEFPAFFDDGRRLMPQQHRQRPGPVAVDDREIGMAQASHLHAHEHLVGTGRVQVEFTQSQGGANCIRATVPGLFEDGTDDLHAPTLSTHAVLQGPRSVALG